MTTEIAIRYGIIYKCTNLINGKIYIGQTTNILLFRIKKHLKNANNKVNRYFYDAINKYGKENFKWEEVDFASSKGELNFKEIYYIKFYNTFYVFGCGYNMTKGGDGGNTYEGLSKERKIEVSNKIIKANKGKKKPDGFAENLSKVHKGKKMPEYGVEKNRLTKINNRKKYSITVKDGLKNRTTEEKRLQVERRKNTMSLKTKEDYIEKHKKEMDSKHRTVICIETNVTYINKKQAAIDVYSDKKLTRYITKSMLNKKQYLGFSWIYGREINENKSN